MTVNKDEPGRRSVEVEVEVPGTPEEVWRAIASGPGISSWFVPTRFEDGDDGTPKRVVSSFGPGMDSIANVTGWEPPHRMTADSQDLGPDAPSIATEWIVEARDGGKCVVRVVHSLFTDESDWDNQLEAWEGGWPDFFRILRLYLTHFPGESSTALQLNATTSSEAPDAWVHLADGLGLADASVGEERTTATGAPPMRCVVEHAGSKSKVHPGELLVRIEEPCGGLGHLFVLPMDGQVYVSVRFFLYGDGASDAAAEMEPTWTNWLTERFPAEEPAS